ncbi:group II truncated hemoglobin [Thiomicrorhabdus sp. 6S2-11]|uniref:Group II truncated hemoglobin n=1 Tax=Thiomicrorhabdus marina TaxID=2818442 RepID=A0ABS3Q7E0_9GAMM|nr:group II truncated hemoglobin [Thiomicrorhabdus marina]MBO1928260.1 group II truncated hemoglobin [Thiomicrorhabdus marina]
MNNINPVYGMGDATYQAVGGHEGLTQLVHDFYDAMDTLPEAAAIRKMHRDDLTESRNRLLYFLSGWMNGPEIYQEKYGTINIPKAHAYLDIREQERDAWLLCMQVALKKQNYPERLQTYLMNQFAKPAEMIRQASQNRAQSGTN